MKSEHKKGGRPTKIASEKMKYKVTIKMATEDFYTYKSLALKAGIGLSEYIRECLKKGYVKERISVEYIGLIRKLSGMANNINQIARQANAQGYTSVVNENCAICEAIDNLIKMIRG